MSYRNEDFWIEVNLENLCANYDAVRKTVGGKKGVMAVLKADAYGHGMVETAKALESHGADYLAVSHFGEGKLLRENGIKMPVLLMTPALPEYYKEIVSLDLMPSLDRMENLKALSQAAGDRSVGFHLKVNTGMNRFGVDCDEIEDLLAALQSYPNLFLAGVFSHLPTALRKDHPQTTAQIKKFHDAVEKIRSCVDYDFDVHLCNSAGAITHPEARWDYVRVGTLLYGQFPAAFLQGTIDLRPTWQAKARILETRQVAPGETVGYGADFRVRSQMRLGVIPVGYHDGFGVQPPLNNVSFKVFVKQGLRLFRGFLRKRPNHQVYYGKKPLPVIGRIAMQTTVVSLEHTDAGVGDIVDVPLRRTATAPTVKKFYM